MKLNFGKVLLLMASLWYGLALTAQTAPGLLDNYSGSSATWLNPATMRTTFVYNDFGIANADVAVRNNFAYLPQHTFLPAMWNSFFDDGAWPTFVGIQPDKDYFFQYFDPNFEEKRDVDVYESVDVTLPSLMLTLAGRHAIGFSIRQRSYTSILKTPWEIPVLATESLEWEPMQHQRFASEGMRFANMEWTEADLSYSATIFEDASFKFDGGLTAKLMMGVTGFTGTFNTLDYEVLHKDSLCFYELDGNVNFALPVDYSAHFRQNSSSVLKLTDPFFRGLGIGGDLGFAVTYKKTPMMPMKVKSACDDYPVNYYWRFGLSFIDIGRVDFNANTLAGDLVGDEMLMDLNLFDTVRSVVGLVELMDTIMGNRTSTFSYGSSFSIGLPTAVSLQIDVNVYDDYYVNATWIHPVSHLLYHNAVEREPMLCVTPRYENSLIGVAFPVTLYNYSRVALGTYLRIAPLEIGVNDILSLAGITETRGVDFYVALRLKLSRGDCLFHPFVDACGDSYIRRSNKKK